MVVMMTVVVMVMSDGDGCDDSGSDGCDDDSGSDGCDDDSGSDGYE